MKHNNSSYWLGEDFYNDDIEGGFYSLVNNVKGEIHECYVNNIKCHAEEGRFGGIIISVI